MVSIRKLSLFAVCLISACRVASLSDATSELQVRPERIVMQAVWVGHRATTKLELQNSGRQTIDVTLNVDAPFEVQRTVRVGGGDSIELDVGVTATRAGLARGTIAVTWGENTKEISIEAIAQQPPACDELDCRGFTFDPLSGTCVEHVLADGVPCGSTNQCITNGQCMSGACVGQARNCDDSNACTNDACEASSGCVHEASTCAASSDPCVVPVCDSVTGCGFAPAIDGAPCGSNDCVEANVCIGGQCVTRPAPDGSECAAPTICRGAGLCRNQACEKPAPNALTPRWRYTPPPNFTVAFLGHVDALGNLYATETWTGRPLVNGQPAPRSEGAFEDCAEPRDGGNGIGGCAPPGVPVTPRSAILSLSPNGSLRFRREVTQGCAGCTYGHQFAIDSAGHRLFFTSQGETQARSTDDGRLLWTAIPTTGLMAFDPRADGGASFSMSPPLLIGNDVVGIPVIEGASDHHSYVQVFDRTTGQFRWQFHRKGHLYGTGVSGNGDLWTSSANCWAVAGEMARVSPVGLTVSAQFVEWMPLVYGDDFSIGSANGSMRSLDSQFMLRDLSPAVGGSVGTALTSGSQVYVWKLQRLMSLPLNASAPDYTYLGVTGVGPEFELIADGGIAWTSQVTDGGYVGAVNARGEELLNCPLSGTVDSPTAITRGRAYVESGGGIVAYDVPGLEVSPSGWVSRGGSLGRGGPTR